MTNYQLRWRDGREFQVPLTEEDRARLVPEINGNGGANDILRWIRSNTKNLHQPNAAVATITEGIIERARDIREWGASPGGFQSKMPIQSLVRAGLIRGHAEPTQGGLL